MVQDLFQEVLRISICQRASKLPAVKGGGLTKNSAFGQNRTRRVRPGFESRSVFIILSIRGTVTLEPFDIQRPTVPLWKGLDEFVNILSAQEPGSILKTDFALSK